jgi:hypothetical protein
MYTSVVFSTDECDLIQTELATVSTRPRSEALAVVCLDGSCLSD